MARKGNQQRNGVDSQGLNHKRKDLGSGDEVSATKWNTKAAGVKVFPGEKLKQSCKPAENTNGFSAEAENKCKNKFFQGNKPNKSSNPVEGTNGINCEAEKRSKKRGFGGGKLKQSNDPAENIYGISAGTENRSKEKVFHGDKLKQSSNSDDNINGYGAGNENRSKRSHRRFNKRERQGMDVAVELEESAPHGCASENVVEDTEASAVQENEEMSSRDDQALKDRTNLSSLISGLYMRNIAENVDFADNLVVRGLKESTVSFIKDVSTWIESCKPMFMSFTTRFSAVCDYCSMKIMLVYPIVLKWLKYFGNILLLLLIVWLDCALRGIYSFVRLGTTCFFSVMWCSLFSVLGMIGMTKFLFVLVSAALVGFFIKFILAVLVVLVSGVTFLWFYGSFWTTALIISIGGLAFLLHHERVTLLITTTYSMYCAWTYTGWLGLLIGLTLSFVSSDVLIYFLKNNVSHPRREDEFRDQNAGMQGQSGFANDDSFQVPTSENDSGFSANRSSGEPSTSGADTEMTSEDEVVRLLNCSDHYATLGFARYQNIDVSLLKREYRKKAMLVHPDKNMGNDKAAEAFKKLQNAYEVLLDSLKRKAYDDELRKEELLSVFRSFQDASLKNRRHGFFNPGFAQPDVDTEDPFGESKRIACRKCGGFHIWVYTAKPKSRARWCQDCQEFHQAKDGDGWVEQSSQPLLFGLLQKVDTPSAYVCADSKIYNATEWYICQGMRCPANTHKPSFHVNTSITSKHCTGKATSSCQKGSRMPTSNMEENMTEEEFFEWMQNAVQAGMFDHAGESTSDFPSPKTGNHTKSYNGNSGSGSRRRKKGKKQW